jgi:quinol monooxygenase YgiN
MIHVIATVDVAEGKRPDFLKAFYKVIPHVRAEKGCIEYGPAVDLPTGIPVQEPVRESTVVIIEKWADLDALKVHLVAPHMKPYREAVQSIVKGMNVQVLTPA